MLDMWVILFLQQSCVDLVQVHLSPILYHCILGKENNKMCNPMVRGTLHAKVAHQLAFQPNQSIIGQLKD